MTIQIVAAMILWAGAAGFGLASTIELWRMVDEVNEQLPKEQQFAAIGWYPGKVQRLYQEYARLYPRGTRRKQSFRLQVAGSMFVLGLALVLASLLK